MRDLETISTAITAAETGHLVFATLHTQDAPQTIDRIIDVFPPHQQQQVRVQLSTTLQGVVTQQLIPTADGKGRAVACEVLVTTPAIRNLIREGKVHQIYSSMQAGGRYGMQTMDMSLAQHVKAGTHHPAARVRALPRPRGAPAAHRGRGSASATGPRRDSAAAWAAAAWAAAAWSWAGCRETRWLRPSSTRSATSRATSSPAPWWPTASCSCCSACARWATRRSRWARRRRASTSRSTSGKPKVKLKELAIFSRQFATMVNSGLPILRALAILAEQTENKELGEALTTCRMDVEQGASLSGAMQKHPKVFNDLYISMVKSGETGGSLDTTLLKPRGDARARGAPARQDQVGHDLPGRRRRPGAADHVRDAAVRGAAVQGHLRPARRHSCRCRPGSAHRDVGRDARSTGTS